MELPTLKVHCFTCGTNFTRLPCDVKGKLFILGTKMAVCEDWTPRKQNIKNLVQKEIDKE